VPTWQINRKEKWYGTGNVDGKFYVDVEQFQYQGDDIGQLRWRQTKIEGAVWAVGGRVRPDLLTLPDVCPDNSLDVRHPIYGAGGHLMAVQLTGVDEPTNLVPVSAVANSNMLVVEREIAKKAQAPRWLKIEIPAYYDGPDEDSRVAKSFQYTLYESAQRPNFGQGKVILSETVRQDWLSVGAFNKPQKELTRAAQLCQGLKFGWKIENVTSAGSARRDLTFLAGHLPPPERRPLAYLDYWLIAYNASGEIGSSRIDEYINSIGLKRSYKLKWVRDLAISGNICRNNNHLLSDIYGSHEGAFEMKTTGLVMEMHHALVIGGGLNSPEVDHIVPESMDGPNCFSNAQITSKAYNAQKGNHMIPFVFRDEAWHTQMAQQVSTDPLVKMFPPSDSQWFKFK
jgi:hypothetical protein